ncbi:hypothetical protein BC940DRAFT_320832 [Gongronella butleri]|nr:hypothetical protein BC940DRAFT_320832 [Gongronella butleri]
MLAQTLNSITAQSKQVSSKIAMVATQNMLKRSQPYDTVIESSTPKRHDAHDTNDAQRDTGKSGSSNNNGSSDSSTHVQGDVGNDDAASIEACIELVHDLQRPILRARQRDGEEYRVLEILDYILGLMIGTFAATDSESTAQRRYSMILSIIFCNTSITILELCRVLVPVHDVDSLMFARSVGVVLISWSLSDFDMLAATLDLLFTYKVAKIER